jgi:hypothetical protein
VSPLRFAIALAVVAMAGFACEKIAGVRDLKPLPMDGDFASEDD